MGLGWPKRLGVKGCIKIKKRCQWLGGLGVYEGMVLGKNKGPRR